MARLIYASNMSLDGCTEDERGAFDWARRTTTCSRSSPTSCGPRARTSTAAHVRDAGRLGDRLRLGCAVGPHGRLRERMAGGGQGRLLLDPGRAPTANTRLERHFDPSAVLDVKAAASRDLLVGGPNLAAQALAAGLVDELAMFVWPVVLGGRNPALSTDMRADLDSSTSTGSAPRALLIPRSQVRSLPGPSEPSTRRRSRFERDRSAVENGNRPPCAVPVLSQYLFGPDNRGLRGASRYARADGVGSNDLHSSSAGPWHGEGDSKEDCGGNAVDH